MFTMPYKHSPYVWGPETLPEPFLLWKACSPNGAVLYLSYPLQVLVRVAT